MNQHRTRFNLLQALRFFAALSVVVFHSSHYIKAVGGRSETFLHILSDPSLSYSVYVFFAISGFVLMHALKRSTVTEFLALRVLRIYPAFWAAVLLVAFIQFAVFREGLDLNWRSLSLLPFGVLPYPLGVEWSLIYEIFFYLMLAAMTLLPSRWMFNLALAIWTALILAGYFIKGWSLTQSLPTWKVIPFSLMNLSFIAGVVAYQIYPRVTRYRWWLLPVSIVALYFARTGISAFWTFSGLAVGSGLLVIFAAAQSEVRDLTSTSPFVKLGNYSYGLYLLHVPVIVALIRLPITAKPPSGMLIAAVVFLAVMLGAIFGWLELHLYQILKQFFTARNILIRQSQDRLLAAKRY